MSSNSSSKRMEVKLVERNKEIARLRRKIGSLERQLTVRGKMLVEIKQANSLLVQKLDQGDGLDFLQGSVEGKRKARIVGSDRINSQTAHVSEKDDIDISIEKLVIQMQNELEQKTTKIFDMEKALNSLRNENCFLGEVVLQMKTAINEAENRDEEVSALRKQIVHLKQRAAESLKQLGTLNETKVQVENALIETSSDLKRSEASVQSLRTEIRRKEELFQVEKVDFQSRFNELKQEVSRTRDLAKQSTEEAACSLKEEFAHTNGVLEEKMRSYKQKHADLLIKYTELERDKAETERLLTVSEEKCTILGAHDYLYDKRMQALEAEADLVPGLREVCAEHECRVRVYQKSLSESERETAYLQLQCRTLRNRLVELRAERDKAMLSSLEEAHLGDGSLLRELKKSVSDSEEKSRRDAREADICLLREDRARSELIGLREEHRIALQKLKEGSDRVLALEQQRRSDRLAMKELEVRIARVCSMQYEEKP